MKLMTFCSLYFVASRYMFLHHCTFCMVGLLVCLFYPFVVSAVVSLIRIMINNRMTVMTVPAINISKSEEKSAFAYRAHYKFPLSRFVHYYSLLIDQSSICCIHSCARLSPVVFVNISREAKVHASE